MKTFFAKMYIYLKLSNLTSFLGERYSSKSRSDSSSMIGSGLTLALLYSVICTPRARALDGRGGGSIIGIFTGKLALYTYKTKWFYVYLIKVEKSQKSST